MEAFFQAALPSLDKDKLDEIVRHLQENGCSSYDDLQFMDCEQDLGILLRPFDLRKVKARKLAMFPVNTQSAASTTAGTPGARSTVEQTTPQSTSSSVCNSGLRCVESWASNFEIPWPKMTDAFMNACKEKKRPKKSDLLDCVRKVCDEVGKMNRRPSASSLGVIAAAMVAEYPDSLADSITGFGVLGDGCTSLRQRMLRQFENRNRGSTNSIKKALVGSFEHDVEDDMAIEGAKRPKARNSSGIQKDSYGCVNWQPGELPNGETHETQLEKKKWLKQEFKKANPNVAEVERCMDLSYVSQRFFLNKDKPPVRKVAEEWPFLLQPTYLLTHFDVLMGFDLRSRADAFFDNKGLTLFNYGLNQGPTSVRHLCELLASVSRQQHNETAKTIGSVLLLPGLLKEDIGEIFKSFEEGTLITEVESYTVSHPYIAFYGDVPFGHLHPQCFLIIESQCVLGPVDFRAALLAMFASYYVLNFAYPNGILATLEFLQRSMGQINPERGSKRSKDAKKKHSSTINAAVLRLLNCLKDFESPWNME